MHETKILLVTGASSDVGAKLIRKVGKNYSKVWAHYRSSIDIINELKEDLGDIITPIQADFSNLESTVEFIRIITENGNYPDHIVHLSAPKLHALQFHKYSWEYYQREIDISLRSIIMLLKVFLPKMAKKKHGKVIFMLSAYLTGVAPKFQSPYITVKYALLGLMHNLAAEYTGKGVMVNAISPNMMETKLLSELPDFIKEQSAQNNSLGRNLYVEEVIPTMEYLLSSGSDAVSGQNITVMGG